MTLTMLSLTLTDPHTAVVLLIRYLSLFHYVALLIRFHLRMSFCLRQFPLLQLDANGMQEEWQTAPGGRHPPRPRHRLSLRIVSGDSPQQKLIAFVRWYSPG